MIGLEDGMDGTDGYTAALVKVATETLESSESLGSAGIDGAAIGQSAAKGWAFLKSSHLVGLSGDTLEEFARGLSGELATTVILVGEQDAAGVFFYLVFEAGQKVQDYCFGWLDEGPLPPEAQGSNERMVSTEDKFVFATGFSPEITDEQLLDCPKFVDSQLRGRRAFAGWELMT